MLMLIASFSIQWPDVFVSVFRIGQALSLLSQHLLNFQCLIIGASDADIFFMTRILWAFLPLILIFCCTLTWLVMTVFGHMCKGNKCCNDYFYQSNGIPWNKIIVSCVTILYFIYPTLVQETFNLVSCRSVCGGQLYLRAVLSEPCWGGTQHMTYFLVVGLPMFALYVVGLPLLAFVAIWRIVRNKKEKVNENDDTLKEKEEEEEDEEEFHNVFGQFYSHFKTKTWWWELTVVMRKIVMSVLQVFGDKLEDMQILLSLLFFAIVFGITIIVRPFADRKRKKDRSLADQEGETEEEEGNSLLLKLE